MRAYFFGNFYLSSIQQGIQAAHVVGEMAYKCCSGDQYRDFRDWARMHKTMILLNGGMASDLRNIVSMFSDGQHQYSWDYFCEEEAALEGSITSVGIIVPEKVYEMASRWRAGEDDPHIAFERKVVSGGVVATVNSFTPFDIRLMELMNSCRLAS